MNNDLSNSLVGKVSKFNNFNIKGISNIALITMVKNEEDIILENLVWHFSIGFRKFVIVDNLSTDGTLSKVKEFSRLTENYAKVFIIEDPVVEYIQGRITTGAYHFARSVWPEVNWVFPTDADEFWFPRKALSQILDTIPNNIDSIEFNSIRYHPTEDYYNFDTNEEFYNKLHYHSKYYINKELRIPGRKNIVKVNADITISQGNHYLYVDGNEVATQGIKYIKGNDLGINLFEFQLRSVEHTYNKFYNGMIANLKAKKSGMIEDHFGVQWDKFSEDINKYGDKAAEVKFNQSFVDLKYLVDDEFPIRNAMELFCKIIECKDSTSLTDYAGNYIGLETLEELNDDLFKASLNGNYQGIVDSINKGALIDSIHIYGATSIFAAVTGNHINAVKLLKEKGADIELAIKEGITPLWKAAHSCYSEIVNFLIDSGADIESTNNEGYTVKHAALYSNCSEVERMLSGGLPLKSPDMMNTYYIEDLKLPMWSDAQQNENKIMVIPKIIHRIWMVWDPKSPEVPRVYKEFDKNLKDLHPDWDIMEWDDKSVLSFIRDSYPEFLDTYLSYDMPVKRHDSSRYLIIKHFGGVFIQHSFKFQKNIDSLLEGSDLVFTSSTETRNTVTNAFFASIPDHDLWNNIVESLVAKSNLPILGATGPHFLDSFINDYTANNKDSNIRLLHYQYLLPFNWNQKENSVIKSKCIEDTSKCFEVFPDAYGFCLWSGSWTKSNNHQSKVDLSILEVNEDNAILSGEVEIIDT